MEQKKKYSRLLTAKQCQFIDWLNNSFKFGKCEIIVHCSDPTGYCIKEINGIFDGRVEGDKGGYPQASS